MFGDLDVNRLLRNHVENPVQRSFRVRFRDELPATRGAATLPSPADVQAVLGAILQRVGDKTEAEEQLTAAAAARPASPLASALLAALRVEQDRASDARPLLRKAAAAPPDEVRPVLSDAEWQDLRWICGF